MAMGKRTTSRSISVIGLGLVACGVIAAACSSGAGASTLANGPVTLKAIGGSSDTTPWASGQTIDVTVTANGTLSLSNLESKGGFTGEPAIKVEECDDPGGQASNLPTVPTNNCDGQTIQSTSYVNADGSFVIRSYHVYALPDSTTFGESGNGRPVCGTSQDQCVLYIGPNQLDFSKPHLFSAPFLVTANSNDQGSSGGSSSNGAPGTTTPSGSTAAAPSQGATSAPGSATTVSGGGGGGTAVGTPGSSGAVADAPAVGGDSSPSIPPVSTSSASVSLTSQLSTSPAGTAAATLASTGLSDRWPWMLAVGGLLFVVGGFGRRSLRYQDA